MKSSTGKRGVWQGMLHTVQSGSRNSAALDARRERSAYSQSVNPLDYVGPVLLSRALIQCQILRNPTPNTYLFRLLVKATTWACQEIEPHTHNLPPPQRRLLLRVLGGVERHLGGCVSVCALLGGQPLLLLQEVLLGLDLLVQDADLGVGQRRTKQRTPLGVEGHALFLNTLEDMVMGKAQAGPDFDVQMPRDAHTHLDKPICCWREGAEVCLRLKGGGDETHTNLTRLRPPFSCTCCTQTDVSEYSGHNHAQHQITCTRTTYRAHLPAQMPACLPTCVSASLPGLLQHTHLLALLCHGSIRVVLVLHISTPLLRQQDASLVGSIAPGTCVQRPLRCLLVVMVSVHLNALLQTIPLIVMVQTLPCDKLRQSKIRRPNKYVYKDVWGTVGD